MKVPMERFYGNIGRYGNTSAATIPIALDEMAGAGAAAAGTVDHVPGLRRRADLGRRQCFGGEERRALFPLGT